MEKKDFLITCNKCGKCCIEMTFTIKGLSKDRIKKEYYKARGCRFEGDKLIVHARCPHLTEDNLCDIHEKKPILCRAFRGQSKGLARYVSPKGCAFENAGR